MGIWVSSYDAPIKFESFIHVLRRVMRVISRRVLLACFCKYSVVLACSILRSHSERAVAIAWVQVPFPQEHWRFTALFVFLRYSKIMPELQLFVFIPHHSDLYTETGLKVLTGKYKWAQKGSYLTKGHI